MVVSEAVALGVSITFSVAVAEAVAVGVALGFTTEVAVILAGVGAGPAPPGIPSAFQRPSPQQSPKLSQSA